MFDRAALSGLKSINTLWAGNGLVKFDPSNIDSRAVVLIPMERAAKQGLSDSDSDEDAGADVNEDDDEKSIDEGGSEDEHSELEEGSDSSSSEVVESQAFFKRKRQDQMQSDRSVKPKKVGFAKEPPKIVKTVAQRKAKTPYKVGNAKRASLGTASTQDDEAYDFSKFF
jgi:hypothetical protein